MLDDACLDEGPGVNFETSTLEMKKESQNENSTIVNTGTKQNEETAVPISIPESKQVSNIPFRIDFQSYFSEREEVIERALNDCQKELIQNNGALIGSWLLTEISLWDTEKERLVLLTKDSLFSVKYDLISLKIVEYNRVPLMDVDTIIAGDLIYPSKSLLPRLNGLAEGVSSILHSAVRQEWSSLTTLSGFTKFEPRYCDIRICVVLGASLKLRSEIYDVKGLHLALESLVPENATKINRPILIENYLGVGSLIHNRNALGFFKIRGKVSF
ncbi:tumor protein p63-regulated gene 1 protein-like [Belonocnema kinseyi]|uniref:tumor protein p63-regulated gene 1 protein-like n=1 Tax=Belonocnema kinseyi TaxID=2817044 RepID=UPI00143D01E2|nr:tumor protein p63-regulated gene 1 protein-like [Belonocnema kinseyi]